MSEILNEREVQVLKHMDKGLSMMDIAYKMNISRSIFEGHKKDAYKKLNLDESLAGPHKKRAAIKAAKEKGLI